MNISLTDIPGILVGHSSACNTGCTAILCGDGLVPGVAVPGMAPGCREIELMRPHSTVQEIHGLCLCGGSAFGLAAASGVARYLLHKGYGLPMPGCPVPLVPAAVIFDLMRNAKPGVLPDEAMGYEAAAAASAQPVSNGPVGAGSGAACGMLGGRLQPAGLGSYGLRHQTITVAALVVNNAMGNIHHPQTGQFLAGSLNAQGQPYSEAQMFELLSQAPKPAITQNTLLAVVGTNARLDKVGCSRVAAMAANGIAWAVRPGNLLFDGDIVFALAQKEGPDANENLLGSMAARAVAMAIAASTGKI